MPYFGSGYYGTTYFAAKGAVLAAPAAPLLFKRELAAWLQAELGVPVTAWGRTQGGNLPCLTYAAVGGSSPPLLTGPRGFAKVTIQFDAWTTSAESAELLARRLYDVLAGGHATVGRALNVVANVVAERSSAEKPGTDNPSWIYRESRDYAISWSDPGPAG